MDTEIIKLVSTERLRLAIVLFLWGYVLETTFVFIKQLTTIDGTICVIHFNTTSVFIKRLIKIFIQHQEGISIQLLFLLNSSLNVRSSASTKISIQLLFLLNTRRQSRDVSNGIISIQLLFLLNLMWNFKSDKVFYFNTTSVFIKHYNIQLEDIRSRFQYNFCFY